jgi:HK97 family phage portal protein
MGFWDIFKKKSQQTHPDYNKLIFSRFGTPLVISQTSNKQDFVDDGYRGNSTVFSIIDLIAKSMSNVAIKVYKKVDEGALKEYKSLTSGNFNDTAMLKAEQLRHKALKPAEDSELAYVLNNPNPDMGYSQWIQELGAFKLITGDSYIQGIAPKTGVNKGKFQQLYVLPAHLVEIVSGDIKAPIHGYRLKYLTVTEEVDSENVCHIKSFNPDYTSKGSHLYGQSPLQAAYRNLAINNDAITTGQKFLKNQGVRGILSNDDNGMLTEEQARALKSRYKAQYQGADNAGDIMITNHQFKWLEMGLPAADLALIEQYNLSIKDLCGVYKVPSILLNDTQASTFNNYREAKKYLYLQAVFPELISIRDELNRWLAPSYGKEYYIDFDFMSIPELQEDMEKVVKQLSLSFWLTMNEKRKVMKFDPIDDPKMDEIFVLANYIPLSDGVTTREQGATSTQMLSQADDYLKK